MSDNNPEQNDRTYKGFFIQNDRYENEFNHAEGVLIGSGGFSQVFRAQQLMDEKLYAIKKINIEDEKTPEDIQKKIRELKVWAKLETDSFVQYRSSWFELIGGKHLVLHIQMDLCWFSLREALIKVNQYFELKTKQLLSPIGYYMAAEVLKEVLNGIVFLHTYTPNAQGCTPILHRDIKPENVLIKGRPGALFVKLADFGLAVIHESGSQSHTQNVGTKGYMAPEVVMSKKYDISADIYSIGVMIQELFNFDINNTKYDNMIKNYENIFQMTEKALNGRNKLRPSAKQLYDNRTEWEMAFNTVRHHIEDSIDLNADYCYDKQFVQYFLQQKYKYNESLKH